MQDNNQTHSPLSPGMKLGEFKIASVLGKGSMGVVYKAYQESLQRYVALKVLKDRKRITLLQNEALNAAKLNHPNIVQIYTIGEEGGIPFFVMAFVEGETLKDLIREKKKSNIRNLCFFPVIDALEMFLQIADGLYYAHEAGILHRDIKPANIIKDKKTNRMMIMDFGLAKPFKQEPEKNKERFAGTPAYTPPEIFKGQSGTTRSDIYSLGASLYETLTGELLYNAKDLKGLLSSITNEQPEDPRKFNPQIPEEVTAILSKCLQKSPAKRYSTVDELSKDIHLFINSGSPEAMREKISFEPVKKNKISFFSHFIRKICIISAGIVFIYLILFGFNIYNKNKKQLFEEEYCLRNIETAKNYLLAKREDLAAPVLHEILQDFSSSRSALKARQIIDSYGKKQMEIARNYIHMKRKDLAVSVLKDFQKNFPDSPYAEKADLMLKEIEY